MDSTKWHRPAELESVLVTLGNGLLLPSPKAQTSPLHSGNYLAVQTETGGRKGQMGIHRADGDSNRDAARGIHTRKRVVKSCMPAPGRRAGGRGGRRPVMGDVMAKSCVRPGNTARAGSSLGQPQQPPFKNGNRCGRMLRQPPRLPWCPYNFFQLFNQSVS